MSLSTVLINKVEILKDGELLLVLEGQGGPSYQYIYRAAAGVYWDPEQNGFKSTIPSSKSYPEWFSHILSVTNSELGLELSLANQVTWQNIPTEVQNEIQEKYAT